LKKKDVVLVWVEGEVDLVCEELVIEVVDCAVWVVCVGLIFEALVHVVVRPCAHYGNVLPFDMVAKVEMLIVGVVDVLVVYIKIWRVHLCAHDKGDHNQYN
jgi:hypothetical protein